MPSCFSLVRAGLAPCPWPLGPARWAVFAWFGGCVLLHPDTLVSFPPHPPHALGETAALAPAPPVLGLQQPQGCPGSVDLTVPSPRATSLRRRGGALPPGTRGSSTVACVEYV